LGSGTRLLINSILIQKTQVSELMTTSHVERQLIDCLQAEVQFLDATLELMQRLMTQSLSRPWSQEVAADLTQLDQLRQSQSKLKEQTGQLLREALPTATSRFESVLEHAHEPSSLRSLRARLEEQMAEIESSLPSLQQRLQDSNFVLAEVINTLFGHSPAETTYDEQGRIRRAA